MRSDNPSCNILPIAVLLGLMGLSGCGGYGPEETVTLDIAGVADKATFYEISDRLKRLSDGGANLSMSAKWHGDAMQVNLIDASTGRSLAKGNRRGFFTSA